MARNVNDALRILRLLISRRNENDPDSTDSVLLGYLNDFVSLTMGADLQISENFGTMTFTIDGTTDGVYTFNDVGASQDFETINGDGFISLASPPAGSVSWIPLQVYQNPAEFYHKWGVENEDLLIEGMPTDLLYYGNEFVFRTIPDTSYIVNLYGYKKHADFSSEGNPPLDYDYWLRYIALGAAVNYAVDYRFAPDKAQLLRNDFARERRLLLTRTHNKIKSARGLPSY